MRKEPLAKLIIDHNIDIIGTQEGNLKQLEQLYELLGNYNYIANLYGGVDGKLHNCATYFRKDLYEVVDSGVFWLSETPNIESIGWDATDTRICQWLKLRDLKSDEIFYLFNAHFYYRYEEARKKSADLIVSMIEEIAADAPVIFMGDLNSTPEMGQIKYLRNVLSDCSVISPDITGPQATFMGGRFYGKAEMQLDYIFVNNHFQVTSFQTLTDTYNEDRYPSDHLPVIARLLIK